MIGRWTFMTGLAVVLASLPNGLPAGLLGTLHLGELGWLGGAVLGTPLSVAATADERVEKRRTEELASAVAAKLQQPKHQRGV